MAALLLLDGVSWSNLPQTGPSSFLAGLRQTDTCCPPPSHGHNRTVDPSITTIRCASSNDLLTKLDPPLPRFPHHYSQRHVSKPGPQLVLEVKPSWPQYLCEEPSGGSSEPRLPNNGDKTSQVKNFADGQDLDARRNQRASPSYLSVSQSRRPLASGAVLQAASSPLQMKELKGMSGFYLGFLTVALGLIAVLQKGGLLYNSSGPTEMCTSCNGYGKRVCNLCKGSGSVTWEGKLRRTDLCPSCLGNRIKQCADCGGYRSRSDTAPFLQQMSKAKTS